MVVDVFVAQGQAVDPLGDEVAERCSLRSGLRWSVKPVAN
jgi:hypothetical protein